MKKLLALLLCLVMVLGLGTTAFAADAKSNDIVILHTDDAVYDEQVRLAKERGTKVPACVPVMTIDTIEDLSAGAHAGKTIAKD